MTTSDLMTLGEVAGLTGLSTRTIEMRIFNQKIELRAVKRTGKGYLYNRADVVAHFGKKKGFDNVLAKQFIGMRLGGGYVG